MDLQEEYKKRLTTVDAVLDSVRSGEQLCTSGVLCEPLAFLERFHEIVPRLENVELLKGRNIDVPFLFMPDLREHVKLLVLTGMTAETIARAVRGFAGYHGEPPILLVDDFREAVLTAARQAREGDAVVLSPACTSFDRFKNFAVRGKTFKDIVNGMEE